MLRYAKSCLNRTKQSCYKSLLRFVSILAVWPMSPSDPLSLVSSYMLPGLHWYSSNHKIIPTDPDTQFFFPITYSVHPDGIVHINLKLSWFSLSLIPGYKSGFLFLPLADHLCVLGAWNGYIWSHTHLVLGRNHTRYRIQVASTIIASGLLLVFFPSFL